MGQLSFPTIEVKEGKTKLRVPDPSRYLRDDGVYEPAWAPVFYNPRMTFNRDVAVAVLTLHSLRRGGNLKVADPLAGLGARGVRFAVEVEGVDTVYINDINPEAASLAEVNAGLNHVKDRVIIESLDANVSLRLRRLTGEYLDYIDIDPFGSPVEFIESALYAVRLGGIVGVTATDTATLCGIYRDACRRRYWASCARVDFEKEMGVRILMGNIVLRAAAYDMFVDFKMAYYADHYFRVYFTVGRGAREADRRVEKVKFLEVKEGGEVSVVDSLEHGVKGVLVGPLWTGPLADSEFLAELRRIIDALDFLSTRDRARKLIEALLVEHTLPPYHYRLDRLCSRIKSSMPSISELTTKLRELGYNATRTHFDSRGFKTDAPYKEVIECLKSLARP